MVRALPSFMIMVMRPFPASQNCHSLALGCQCNSRKAPGLRVTSAAATFLLGGKLRESTIRTSPPGVFLVGAMLDILNVYWMGDSTRRPPIAALSSARDRGSFAGKMYIESFGSLWMALLSSLRFFDKTSGGVCATKSERRKVPS